MKKVQHDFAGWVTKNDTLCVDGVTIRKDAFKHGDGQTVPLVWNHDYNTPTNILGTMRLVNKEEGVYGYGYFNDTADALVAKDLVRHGDINNLSIGANKIKREGSNVVHGSIYEVSLVVSGANPGALIESSVIHSADGDSETAIIYLETLIHSTDGLIQNDDKVNNTEEEEKVENTNTEERTIGDVMDTLSAEQEEAVMALLAAVIEENEDDDYDDEGEEDTSMKQNAFNRTQQGVDNTEALKHSLVEAIAKARKDGASSLRQVMTDEQNATLKHGINSIETLFPEAMHNPNGPEPVIYKDPNTAYAKILNKVTKSPFSRVKVLFADLTEDEARAKGYIKGTFKKGEYFSLIKRVTTPCTIYKKQKLDRDDIVDITDFNVVSFMNREMDMMIREELARAVLVGDGREVDDDDKINETNIRPIISDNEFFTIHKSFTDTANLLEVIIRARSEYRGSGTPDLFIDPTLLADLKLMKGTDNRFLFGDIPSTAAIAARLGVGEIIDTSFMIGNGVIMVNLGDYTLGASKGGQLTNFDDFDIDFNQYKYLIETRLSGALTMPKSAIHFATTLLTGANDTVGGMTYGKRQSDPKPASDAGRDGIINPPVAP